MRVDAVVSDLLAWIWGGDPLDDRGAEPFAGTKKSQRNLLAFGPGRLVGCSMMNGSGKPGGMPSRSGLF